MTAQQIPDLIPGSPEWLKVMTASKVSAVLGLSPWTSPYTLWQLMAGNEEPEAQTDVMARGHYLEPGIVAWFRDQHPEWDVVYPAGTWASVEQPWMVTNPDGLVGTGAVLEVKTDARGDEWGQSGTDQVPVWYRAQAMWGMAITGREVTHFAVLGPYLDMKEFVVEYDEDDAAFAIERAAAFLASIEAGTPPALDGHDSTYQSVRKLHPEIDRTLDVEISADLARDFTEALIDLEAAEVRAQHVKALVADATGTGRRAVVGKKHIATRKARNGGTPWIEAARGLTKQPRGIAS
ncbi:lambda-exonuclease family protein [Kribbella qitaiheensis]|uniref:lambda-exonuclease family protein n=1 Tax=Kribbella qitaiheensis TaxID=1544730 RepID=UPI00361B7DD3